MKEPISWYRVEELHRKSITGKGLSDEELSYVTRAFLSNKKYIELHVKVKREEGNKVTGKETDD